MSRNVPDDRDIVLGQTERWRRCSTTEPRTTYRVLNRSALHTPELYQVLSRDRPRPGGVGHGTSGLLGADRDRSNGSAARGTTRSNEHQGNDLAARSNAGTGGITDARTIGQLCCSIARSVRYRRRCKSAGNDQTRSRPAAVPRAERRAAASLPSTLMTSHETSRGRVLPRTTNEAPSALADGAEARG